MEKKYFEETKNYYFGLLSDNVKDLASTRKLLFRNANDLRLVKEFIENGDFLDYENYTVAMLAESIDSLNSLMDFLWDVANNIDCCLDFLEINMKGDKEND